MNKCLSIYINNESIIFIIPCFNQFFFRLSTQSKLLYVYPVQATICQPNPSYYILYMSVQATICAGLENIFFSYCMLCKIYMLTEHVKMLILCDLQDSWARLRREQTHTSFSVLIQGHMLIEENCGLNPLRLLWNTFAFSLPPSLPLFLSCLPPSLLLSTSLSSLPSQM